MTTSENNPTPEYNSVPEVSVEPEINTIPSVEPGYNQNPKRNWLQRFWHWPHFWLIVILVVTLGMHFSVIMIPDKPLFDEQYYATDASSIIQGHGSERGEHPPLGKLFVVAGEILFGNNQFGWRFFSVIMGTIAIIFFYFVCRRLQMPTSGTLAATFFLSFENLTFVQASIGMLDIFALTFTIGAFYFYLQENEIAAGAAAGLGTLSKLDGALALPTIVVHWLWTNIGHIKTKLKELQKLFILLLLALITFFALYPVFNFLVFHKWNNPIDQILSMLRGTASLTFANVTHEARSYPWTWLLKHEQMAYNFNPDYSGAISYDLWALIMPVVIYMIIRAIQKNKAAIFGLSWFAGTYLVWILIIFTLNRVTYPYYFYPTVGAICIGLGVVVSDLIGLAKRRGPKLKWTLYSAVTVLLLAHLASFILLSPVLTRFKSSLGLTEWEAVWWTIGVTFGTAIWIGNMILCYRVATYKKRNPQIWTVFAFFFILLTTVILVSLRASTKDDDTGNTQEVTPTDALENKDIT